MTRCTFAILTLVAGSISAATLKPSPAGAPCATDYAFCIKPVCAERCDAQARVVHASAGLEFEVDAPFGVDWDIQLASPERCWSPVVRVNWSSESPLQIPVYRAATVSGKLRGEHGDLEASFDPPSAKEKCSIRSDGRFLCRIPSGVRDLKLAVDGASPWYFWDVDTTRDVDVGELVPRLGASLSGSVDSSRKNVVVTLRPRMFAESHDTAAQSRLQTFKAEPNSRGFFQFSGLPPGTYTIEAAAPSASPSIPVDIEVREPREYALETKLRLNALAELDIAVLPPLDPFGKPWRVKVARYVPMSAYLKVVAEGTFSESGFWKREKLAAGPHQFEIVDSTGNVHHSRDVDLQANTPLQAVSISFVRIAGTVRTGERPLAARLHFNSLKGEQVTTRSDAEGRFETYVAHEGNWTVEISPFKSWQTLRINAVAIRSSATKDVATVDLSLPGGSVRGKVVDEDGKPIKSGVLIRIGRGSPLSETMSDPQDGFRLVGLARGSYDLIAQAEDAEGDPRPITIGDTEEEVTLVARHTRNLLVWLGTSSGRPLAGAIVRYWTSLSSYIHEAATGPGGTFTVPVTSTTPLITAVIVAPGAPRALVTLSPSEERLEVVLPDVSGRLHVILGNTPPWPWIVSGPSEAVLFSFMMPHSGGGPPPEFQSGGMAIDIVPGDYSICADPFHTSDCMLAHVVAGVTTTVDFKDWNRKRIAEGKAR
jgi:hypothetical protein